MTFDIGLHEACVRVGVRYVITKFSQMDSLPNFLPHGAPLCARFARTRSSAITVVPREIEDKSYAKFWDKQGALWFLWKWWILTFQLQQRPDEQGWSACSFELICCYLFTRTEPVPSSWTNKHMLRLWWSQFGPIKYKETISWYWGGPQKSKKFFKLGILGAFLHLNTINNIFYIVSL